MKKIFCLVLLFVSIYFLACNKLNLLPISSKSVEGFYSNETEVEQAVNGCYNSLATILVGGNHSYWISEARSDNTFQGMGYDDGPINRFTETSTLPALSTIWAQHYNLIFRTNKILEALESVDLESSKRDQFEGEAKFLRALTYFNLVRIFGEVPLVLRVLSLDEGYGVSRSSLEEIYMQIESDLSGAATLLPPSYTGEDFGRATSWAAKGMLGKVYVFESGYPLRQNKWEQAKDLFSEIISSGEFSFFDNYADVFAFENENGNQSLFSLKFLAVASGGNSYPTRNAPNDIANLSLEEGGVPFGGSPNMMYISEDLIRSFEPGDIRKETSIQFEWVDRSGNTRAEIPFVKKYLNGPVISARNWDIDWIVLRYDEILLLYAECLNEIGFSAAGEAVQILNKFRVRANVKPFASADIVNQEDFRLKMELERRHEFCFENIRWFDLVRTDRALDVMSTFLEAYNLEANFVDRTKYLFPIPQREININPGLEQNPGYEF